MLTLNFTITWSTLKNNGMKRKTQVSLAINSNIASENRMAPTSYEFSENRQLFFRQDYYIKPELRDFIEFEYQARILPVYTQIQWLL